MAIALAGSASLPGSICLGRHCELIVLACQSSRDLYRYISSNSSEAGSAGFLTTSSCRSRVCQRRKLAIRPTLRKEPVNTEVHRQNTPSPHVLVADDDVPLGNFLRRQLESESFQVNLVQDGELASEALARDKYHLLILVLTARTQVEDRVLSLESGADDCLLKPFSVSELLARVKALLRRHPYLPGSPLQVGDLTLDIREYRVERGGKRINLSGKEFALLEYLMRNARQTVTRAMIMEHVWNMPFDNSTNLVDVYVKYVRDKVDNSEFSTQLIRTVRGVGYVFSDN